MATNRKLAPAEEYKPAAKDETLHDRSNLFGPSIGNLIHVCCEGLRTAAVAIRLGCRVNVLISSAGRRVSLTRAFQRAVRHLLPGSMVFTSDAQASRSAACQISDGSFAVPRLDDPRYIDALLKACLSHDVRLVVPTIDTELEILATHREAFAADGIQVIISDLDLIRLTADKVLSQKLFTQVGLDYPALLDPDDLTFPLIAKPRAGSASVGVVIAHGLGDLPPRYLNNPSIMFQALVPRDSYDEITVDCYYSRGGQLARLVPRLRIETRGGEISKGQTLRDTLARELRQQLALLPGARGCITLQCFANTERNRILAIEINPRFGGGYPLADAAGAGFPEALVSEYLLSSEPCWEDSWSSGLLMLRYDEAVWLH